MSNSIQVKEWRKRFKHRIVESFGGSCGICNYNKCDEAFHCHHLDPNEKEYSLSYIMSNPQKWKAVVPELRKCVLLCSRCHTEVHAGVTELPKDIRRFDESFAIEKEKHEIECPICGKMMPDHQKTCSYSCAAKKAETYNWNSIDLIKLFTVDKKSKCEIARMVGCTESAVRKRLKKLKIIE